MLHPGIHNIWKALLPLPISTLIIQLCKLQEVEGTRTNLHYTNKRQEKTKTKKILIQFRASLNNTSFSSENPGLTDHLLTSSLGSYSLEVRLLSLVHLPDRNIPNFIFLTSLMNAIWLQPICPVTPYYHAPDIVFIFIVLHLCTC